MLNVNTQILKILHSYILFRTDGSRGGAFGLDTSGNIVVASHLDASEENKYNISVEISDGFNNVVARVRKQIK